MTYVWDLAELGQAETLVALALADHADDAGLCWPSLERIAAKSRLSVRQVQRVVQQLEGRGLLVIDRGGVGRGRTSRYQFNLRMGDKASPIPADPDPERVTSETQKGDIAMSQKGDIAMSPKPSVTINEPSFTAPAEIPPALDRRRADGWRPPPRAPVDTAPGAYRRGVAVDPAAEADKAWRDMERLSGRTLPRDNPRPAQPERPKGLADENDRKARPPRKR